MKNKIAPAFHTYSWYLIFFFQFGRQTIPDVYQFLEKNILEVTFNWALKVSLSILQDQIITTDTFPDYLLKKNNV